MAKIHSRSYNPNQIVLFPQRIDENIPSDDPVRILNAMVDNLDLSSFHKLYKEFGRSPYHPRMMLTNDAQSCFVCLYEQYLFLS